MANIEQIPEVQEFGIEDIERIEKMPEENIEQVRAKHQAFNDLIIELGKTVQNVHEESGSNSPDDESQEESQENQDRGLVGNALLRARNELSRLGQRLQELE